jgi:hypothetical protein
MKTAKYVTALLLCFQGLAAFGWNLPGHMAVTGLAYDELTAAQQKKLAKLIRKHPGFNLIQQGFADDDIDDREVVMAAATWPDLAKFDTKHYHHNGYEETDPAITSVTFSTNMHKGWHFVDTPLWVDDSPASALPDVPRVNATNLVTVLMAQLKSNESDEAKAYDLGWLLHLVGDIHQPLHCITGVTPTFPKGDRGGNSVKLRGEFHDGIGDLHAFWDDVLGETAHMVNGHPRLDQDIMTADEISDAAHKIKLPAYAEKLEPPVWAKESFNMAKRDVYSLPCEEFMQADGDKELRMTLTKEYHKTAVADTKRRIRIAGHRLALLLKQIL